ncbi:MAG TPA: N-acetyl-gamma-glutamyl-phosphate reductase [Cytophagales bacterium]|nr:N-acetyl-gamma-glutamyl-phosphate reductase [Cytophagales bacterium]HAA17999.1 N-acetyl-gamma-glutamyl-phosphate reductase [Cytophagales bacterium]
MIKASIVGGAGYTAGELIRILLHHPEVELVSVGSKSHAGESLWKAHSDVLGDTDLTFAEQPDTEVDVVFLCQGHGKSKGWVEANNLPAGTAIVDLSSDYRLTSTDSGHDWAYGLPEAFPEQPTDAVANPGCFATAIQLALLPLAKAGLIKDAVHINGITGSTGAGAGLSATGHFSWRNNNVSVYKAFKHQHLHEIRRTLTALQPGFDQSLHFVPVRGNFTRGILATAYTAIHEDDASLKKMYADYYAEAAFTHVYEGTVHLKQVVNSNKGLVQVEKHDGMAFITVAIDNLLKGASGQAVQNMNRRFGLDETVGLHLKGSAF